MNHSENLELIATALSVAQGEFESVAKDAANPFFKSAYASLPAVVQAASPILARNGLAISQLLGHDEQGDTLTTVLLHKSGQYIADTMSLRPVKNDPQAQGSATTYGRRYAYMAVLGLVADDDDDGNAGSSGGQASKPAARKPSAKPKAKPKAKEIDKPADTDQITEDQAAHAKWLYTESGLSAADLHWNLVAVGAEPASTEMKDLGAAVRTLGRGAYKTLCENLDTARNEKAAA